MLLQISCPGPNAYVSQVIRVGESDRDVMGGWHAAWFRNVRTFNASTKAANQIEELLEAVVAHAESLNKNFHESF